MNNKKLIAVALTATTAITSSTAVVFAQDEHLSVESYSVCNKHELLLNLNKDVSAETIKDSLIVKDADGNKIGNDRITAVNQEPSAVAISIDNIFDSFEYNISFDSDNMPSAEDGSTMQEEYEYKLFTSGIRSSYYDADMTGTTDEWQCYTTNATADAYDGYVLDGWFFFANRNHEYEQTEDGQIRNIKGSANAHCEGYENAIDYDDFTLEFDYKNMSEAGVYKEYAPFRVIFRTDKYTPSKPESWGYYPDVKSDRGGYILELFNCATNVNLLKWDGTEFPIDQTAAGENTKKGTSRLYPKQTIENSIGTESRYKLDVKNTDDGDVHIVVMRAVYKDGTLGDYETVIDYTDSDNPITDGTFWFSQRGTDGGTAWGGYWYGSSFIRNLKCYPNVDWNVERNEIPHIGIESITMEGNRFRLVFSHDMSREEIEKNVSVYSQSCDDDKKLDYETEIDGSVVYIIPNNIELDKTYYIYVDKSITSKLGYGLAKNSDGYVYTVATKGMSVADFGAEGENEKWSTKGLYNEDTAFTYNNMLFVSSADTKKQVSGIPKGELCLIYNKNYKDYMYKNSTLEFDYKNNNNTKATDNGAWASMYVIFRINELTEVKNQWGQFTQIESSGGGYWLELFNYGKTVSLRKWDGTVRDYAPVATLSKKDKDLLFYKDVAADVDCNKYRYRINTVNLENGVRISVYRAEYDGFGELSDYTLVGEADDLREEAPREGSFAFSAEESNVDDDGKGWLSSHSVNNVSYFTPVDLIEMTDIKDLKNIAEGDSLLGGFNGRTTVTADEYDNLLYSINLGKLLEKAGYSETDILGYTDALALQTKIPTVTSANSADLSTEFKVDFKTSVNMDAEYINKDNITVLKSGEKFDDYTIEILSPSSFRVSVYNDKRYDSRYRIILSKNIASSEGMIFADDYTYTIDSEAKAELSDIVFSDKSEETGSAEVRVTGGESGKYTVMLCVYEVCEIDGKEYDKLIGFGCGSGKSVTAEFEKPQKYYAQAVVYSGTDSMVQLYRTITSKEVTK